MIKLNNVFKSFKEHKALSDLSIEVKSGEIYGLLGANGAGKSTTLNLILGFLTADSGSIKLKNIEDNSDISTNSIGYIPENVNLYPLNALATAHEYPIKNSVFCPFEW